MATESGRGGSADATWLDGFQETVAQVLLRNRSVLDVMTKVEDAAVRLSRTISYAATGCGCIEIHAERQRVPTDIPLKDAITFMRTHVEGSLCQRCREALITDMGGALFYLAALANTFGVPLAEVLETEYRKTRTLGVYSLG
jgi:hypothetical protein